MSLRLRRNIRLTSPRRKPGSRKSFWIPASAGMTAMVLSITSSDAFAKPKLPTAELRGEVCNDLPAPYNLQAVVLNKTVTLAWQWQPPEVTPLFEDFGFEVKRNDGRTAVISGLSWSDLDLVPGSYTYTVRVRGGSRERRKRVTHVSDYSEPVHASIKVTCPQAPTVTLNAEPTKKVYSAIPSLRLHLTGDVKIPEGCTLTKLFYLLDTGTGIVHSGPLQVDARGRYDEFIDAIGPEDEIPAGSATFSVTATAEDEAGPSSSGAFTITIELQNRFAPKEL